MGNNQSQSAPPPQTEVVRRPPSRPNAPPSARPVSDLGPKGPSYHSPENLVLPKDIPVLRLRPVSMELSKFHPEYKDMFNHGSDNEEDKENIVDLDEEEEASKLEKLGTSPPRPPPPILKKGNVANGGIKTNVQLATSPTMNQTPNGNIPTGNGYDNASNNTTTVNGNATNKNIPYRPSHRRQISLGQDHNIIMEEPEENIDNRVKLDPLMQSFPGATGPSLPVKNNFNLDYSYQLTYVQLAEHRRNKTIEELEKKTGKKLSDLSADLIENQEQPFKRAAPSRVSSKSTGSGGSALSSKKKKAPEPPGTTDAGAPPPPPPLPTGASNTLPFPSKTKVTVQQQPYSVDNEPPADYEIDSPRREVNMVLPRYKIVSRNNSRSSPQPTPSSPVFSSNTTPRKNVQVSRNNSLSMGKPEIILKKTPSVTQKEPDTPTNEVPWLLQIKNLSETMSARRQQSMDTSDTPELSKEQNMELEEIEKPDTRSNEMDINDSSQKNMVYESSNNEFKPVPKNTEQIDPNSNKVDLLNSLELQSRIDASKLARHSSTLGFEEKHVPVPALQRQASEPAALSSSASQVDPVRRLNSLLQHDIKAAANAKCLKLKKQVTQVPPKPKDPHEVFREQLAKACAQRDERVKVEGTIDDKLKQSEQDNDKVGKVMETSGDRKDSSTSSEPPETLPKPPRYHKNVTMNRNKTPDRLQVSQNNRASTALDWTPEDDLDSDDNLSDRETMTSKKTGSDGFKSTIIPNTVTDLKSKKKNKKEKKSKPSNEDDSNKQKFGSVKKFKKSMHKSVRNAFGSISKASGKILRKQKTEDLEQVDDVPRNWKLSNEQTKSSKTKASSRAKSYMVPNNYGESDSDSEIINTVNSEETDNEIKQNGHVESEVTSDNESEELNDYRNKSKEASLSARKLSPREQKYVYESEEEIAIAKYKEKKKKQKLKASMKEELEKERESAALKALEEARERERKLEAERRKQLEMELEIHKIREAETRERLQRLENAHLQQQLNAHLLSQQQQNMSMQISAPPLPPAGNYNQNFGLGPDPAQTQAYTNLFGQQLPQNGYQNNFGLYHPTQTNPLLNGGVPGMTYDINEYMRMLGVQTPPTSQQMAYFLNSMTLSGQPFDRKSNPTLMEVINQQDPMKHYTTGYVSSQLPDATGKLQNLQNWTSAPNINISSGIENSVPMSDFVASYSNLNGANSQSDKKDSKKGNSRNPLYNSEDSDEGLSPQRTVVRANVGDFRKLPARTESGKFMRQYGSSNYISKTSDTHKASEQSEVQIGSGLSQGHLTSSREDSVSPSNSTSTIDSAITSPSVTLSTPSSPSRSVGVPASPMVEQRSDHSNGNGFRTILDLTSANVKTHVTMIDGQLHDS